MDAIDCQNNSAVGGSGGGMCWYGPGVDALTSETRIMVDTCMDGELIST